jgi:hypothetical protein
LIAGKSASFGAMCRENTPPQVAHLARDRNFGKPGPPQRALSAPYVTDTSFTNHCPNKHFRRISSLKTADLNLKNEERTGKRRISLINGVKTVTCITSIDADMSGPALH